MNQDYPDIELVVVEDGSRAMEDLVTNHSARSGCSITYHSIAKSGRCAAGNVGLERARGELLGFLDEDDELYQTHVATLAAALVEPDAPDLAFARSDIGYSRGLSGNSAIDVRSEEAPLHQPFSRARLWERNLFPIQSAMFRRKLFETCGGFDVALDRMEDWDLWLRFAAVTEFASIDAVTSRYRLPAEDAIADTRRAEHDRWERIVRTKHADLVGTLRFGDVSELLAARPDVSGREAYGALVRGLLRRVGIGGDRAS